MAVIWVDEQGFWIDEESGELRQASHRGEQPLNFGEPSQGNAKTPGQPRKFLKRGRAKPVLTEHLISLNHRRPAVRIDVDRLGTMRQSVSQFTEVESRDVQSAARGGNIVEQIHPLSDKPGGNLPAFLVRHAAEDTTPHGRRCTCDSCERADFNPSEQPYPSRA